MMPLEVGGCWQHNDAQMLLRAHARGLWGQQTCGGCACLVWGSVPAPGAA